MSVQDLTIPNNFEVHAKTITTDTLTSTAMIAVVAPSDANAAIAGVPLNGLYSSIADPAVIYIRRL
jgi:hypothetical protein